MLHVLIADKFEESGRKGLEAIGCKISYHPDADDIALMTLLTKTGAEVLVVRSRKISETLLGTGSLKLVVRAGAGFNTIDVAAASRRGIYVSNCPAKNSIAVAELAFGLILALDRRIADNVISLRQGQWNKKEFSKAKGLYGRTLGLIGVGNIGGEMIPRAKAFGMPVVAWSRSLTAEKAAALGIQYAESPSHVAAQADIVSAHLAFNQKTRGLLNAGFFNSMKKGAYFINTSRGEVVDEPALLEAMKTRELRVGSDVYASEPSTSEGPFSPTLAKETLFYGTHHIGASTSQAQEAIAAETVRIIQVFNETANVPNVVNLARQTPATHTLVVRHHDRPGVLASVLEAIKRDNINVQEMENVIFEGAEAAVARINLDKAPSEDSLAALRKNAEIIELGLLGLKH